MSTPEDHILREAARRIRETNLRQLENNKDVLDELRAFYGMMLIHHRILIEAGFSRINALVVVGMMIWLTIWIFPILNFSGMESKAIFLSNSCHIRMTPLG